MNWKLFEVTLEGYDVGSDDTDHLVKWGCANTIEQVRAAFPTATISELPITHSNEATDFDLRESVNPYTKGFKQGDKLRCISARGIDQLTAGALYEAVRDEREGIYEDRPVVSVRSASSGSIGRKVVCAHSSRFEKAED
jgi:hypothetical protein